MAHDSLSQKIKAMICRSHDISTLAFKRVVVLSHQRGATNAPRLFYLDQGGSRYDVSTALASSTFYAQQNAVPPCGRFPYHTAKMMGYLHPCKSTAIRKLDRGLIGPHKLLWRYSDISP